MKALRIHEYGGPLQLDEIERPIASAGKVVVRNLATSFNPIDHGRASGVMRQVFPQAAMFQAQSKVLARESLTSSQETRSSATA
jgi:NADPH:quinone reductase-like Zn-dependent oxidoreductase